MSFPTSSDLVSLSFGIDGQPLMYLSGANIDTTQLTFGYNGMPFVATPIVVVQLPNQNRPRVMFTG